MLIAQVNSDTRMHTVKCQGCSVSVAAAEVRLDATARQLCRKCHAFGLVAEADATQRRQGLLRHCRRCDGFTLRVGVPLEVEVEGYGPGFEASAPMAVAHRFRCSQCRGWMILLTPATFAVNTLMWAEATIGYSPPGM